MLNGPSGHSSCHECQAPRNAARSRRAHSCELLRHRRQDPSLLLHRDPLRSFFTETPFTRKAWGKRPNRACTPARTASPSSRSRVTATGTRARCTRSGATTSAPTAAASSRRRATWCGTAGWCTRGGATTSARTAAAASARRATCECTARPSTRRCGRTRASTARRTSPSGR